MGLNIFSLRKEDAQGHKTVAHFHSKEIYMERIKGKRIILEEICK